MKPSSKRILTILHVICWVIFLGLLVQTGTLLFSGFVSFFVRPEALKKLYMELNLSDLRDHSTLHYVIMVSVIIVVSALKAFIFYQLIKIFLKINYVNPFSKYVAALISSISYLALGVGLLSAAAISHSKSLMREGVSFPPLDKYLGGAGEFLFFAGVIFFIAQVFKAGIQIQTENELTI